MNRASVTMPRLSSDRTLVGLSGEAPAVWQIVVINPSKVVEGYFEVIYARRGLQFCNPAIAGSRVELWLAHNDVDLGAFEKWKEEPVSESREATRHVYFIADDDGFIKIGSANSVEARLSQLQTGARQHLRVIASMPGSTADEKALHARFASSHVRGEWFHPSRELLEFVEGVTR